jgi:hypothetical protein
VPAVFRRFRGGPRARAKAIVDYVQRRGYALVNPVIAQVLDASRLDLARNPALRQLVKASVDVGDIEGLEQGNEDWLAFRFDLGGKEATIFNFSVSARNPASTGGGVQYKVAKIGAPGLPRFLLGRNSLAHTVQDAVDSAVGTPKTAISVDTALYPEFSSHYWLKGSDPATVKQFLTPEKIKFIEETKPRGTIATNALYLVYFEYGVLGSDQELDSFIDQIGRLAANFL